MIIVATFSICYVLFLWKRQDEDRTEFVKENDENASDYIDKYYAGVPKIVAGTVLSVGIVALIGFYTVISDQQQRHDATDAVCVKDPIDFKTSGVAWGDWLLPGLLLTISLIIFALPPILKIRVFHNRFIKSRRGHAPSVSSVESSNCRPGWLLIVLAVFAILCRRRTGNSHKGA